MMWPTLLRGLASFGLVIALLAVFVVLARKGAFRFLPQGSRPAIRVETGASLGERRSLVIVTVENKRLLIGLTPVSVSLVTELAPPGAPLAPS